MLKNKFILFCLNFLMTMVYNVFRFHMERVGADVSTAAMHHFSDFIYAHGLVYVLLEGGNFMWSNNCEIASMSRIDRFTFHV